jgi:hypothetical protein
VGPRWRRKVGAELSDAVGTTIRGGRERRLGGRSTDGGENEEGRAPPQVVGEGRSQGGMAG